MTESAIWLPPAATASPEPLVIGVIVLLTDGFVFVTGLGLVMLYGRFKEGNKKKNKLYSLVHQNPLLYSKTMVSVFMKHMWIIQFSPQESLSFFEGQRRPSDLEHSLVSLIKYFWLISLLGMTSDICRWHSGQHQPQVVPFSCETS